MNKIFLFFFLSFVSVQAQTNFKFETPLQDCDDLWVICPANEDGSYDYGFVYTDREIGFTLKLEGYFIINSEGDFVPKNDRDLSSKALLYNLNSLFAVVPQGKHEDLGVKEVPEWLHEKKEVTDNLTVLSTNGYLLNNEGKHEMALVYLLNAYELNPGFSNVRYEIAKAYNLSKRGDKAIPYIEEALRIEPESIKLLAQLAYALLNQNKIKESAKVAKKAMRKSKILKQKCDIAYYYAKCAYNLKNKKLLKKWVGKAKHFAENNQTVREKLKAMLTSAKEWDS